MFRYGKLNLAKRVFAAFIAFLLIFSYGIGPSAHAKGAASGAKAQKLAPPSIWKPLANTDRAIVRQSQLELMLGLMFLRHTKGEGIGDVNAALQRIQAARREIMEKQGLAAEGIGAPQFLNCIWDENDKILKATFALSSMPDQTLIVAFDSENRYTIAKGALKPEEALAQARGYEAKKEIAMQPGAVMSISQAVSAMLLKGQRPVDAASAIVSPQYKPEDMPALLCAVSNILLDTYAKQSSIGPVLKEFYKAIVAQAQAMDPAYSQQARDLSVAAGEVLILMSWMENKTVPGAANIRLTDNVDRMVKRPDKYSQDKSFLDLGTTGLSQAMAEGTEGIYFRGVEGVSKVGKENIAEAAIYNRNAFNSLMNNTVLYIMDHGFLPVPRALAAFTTNGNISTIHETFFVSDLLPNSIQCASTGPGHLQGLAVDLKYVTEGTGIQYNKIYDENGKLVKVIAQYLKPGSWAIALPGAVDSIENLGGLRFNDFTAKVTPQQAVKLNPYFNFAKMEAARPAIEAGMKVSPYIAVRTDKGISLIKNDKAAPETTWVAGIPANVVNAASAIELYNNLTEARLQELVEALAPVTSGTTWQTAQASLATIPAVDTAYVTRLGLTISPRPIVMSTTPETQVLQRYAWGGYTLSALLGKAREKIAEIWFNSTQRDARSSIPGTQMTLAEVIEANPEAMLGPGMTAKPVFSKILGKDEAQPQMVQLGFNEKIKIAGKETFINWLIEERRLATELKNALVALNMTEAQFAEYTAAYEKWVSEEVRAQWKSVELPRLPAFMTGFNPAAFERIRQVRANIVSVLNEMQLAPGQVILAPVGYIHSLVGSYQTHPPANNPEAKNEAWYIFSAGKNEQGQERLLYFEPQQTSNTTYSPADFPTPIVWRNGRPEMRKDLRAGLEAILAKGESAPKTEEEAIRIMAERALIFEPTRPEDFLVNNRITDVTGSDLYGESSRAKVESLIESTYPVWPNELFALHRIELNGEGPQKSAFVTVNPAENVYHELIVLRGAVEMTAEGETTKLGPGSSVFVPASYRAPYKLASAEGAEVMRLYPRAAKKPEESVAKLTLPEVERIVREETKDIGATLKAVSEKANPKEGVVIIAIDDNLYRSFAVSVAPELQKLIDRSMPEDSIKVVRGKGDQLVGAIRRSIDEAKAKGYKVRSVVTQINAQTSADIKDDLAKVGVVLNVSLKNRNVENNYIQFIRLMDLSMKIAYDFQLEDIRSALARITGMPVTVTYIIDMLGKKIIDVLPQLRPVDGSVAVQAYQTVKKALSSL